MNIPKFAYVKSLLYFLFVFFSVSTCFAQVGIGTVSPSASSMLDVSSTTQGMLTPRMTTAQRLAITTPANSLLVYDTNLQAFYYYNTPLASWVKLANDTTTRNNYKLVKSAADLAPELAAGGGTSYLLNTNTFYEINGTITLTAPINLNNAYLAGIDTNEDVLSRATGNVFAGSFGGSIRNITITGGGTAFNISGANTQTLLLQNTIIAGMSSVGTISGIGTFFSNIVQYVGNTNGVTYNNVTNLLLSNQGWFGNNGGVYETFTGTFTQIQKVSGFSTVPAGATAINVSSSPVVVEGVILNTLFTGPSTTYVNRYPGAFAGYNFNNNWVINSPGIPRESDNEAAGNIYFNGDLANGFAQNTPNPQNEAFNLSSNTTLLAPNNFRVTSPSNNRLTYQGRRTKTFQVNATLAVRGNSANTANQFYSFFFRKGLTTGVTTTLVPTNTVMKIPTNPGSGSELVSLSISGTVELAPGEFIEIWGQRLTGGNLTNAQIAIFSVNMNMK